MTEREEFEAWWFDEKTVEQLERRLTVQEKTWIAWQARAQRQAEAEYEASLQPQPYPPLPETDWELHMPARRYQPAWTSSQAGYTADDMRAYVDADRTQRK